MANVKMPSVLVAAGIVSNLLYLLPSVLSGKSNTCLLFVEFLIRLKLLTYFTLPLPLNPPPAPPSPPLPPLSLPSPLPHLPSHLSHAPLFLIIFQLLHPIFLSPSS